MPLSVQKRTTNYRRPNALAALQNYFNAPLPSQRRVARTGARVRDARDARANNFMLSKRAKCRLMQNSTSRHLECAIRRRQKALI